MNRQDLVNLISIRNHITVVLNDRNVCGKSNINILDNTRTKIDRFFVEQVLSTDLFKEETEEPIELSFPGSDVDENNEEDEQDKQINQVRNALVKLPQAAVIPAKDEKVAEQVEVTDPIPQPTRKEELKQIEQAGLADDSVKDRVAAEKKKVAEKLAAEKKIIAAKKAQRELAEKNKK